MTAAAGVLALPLPGVRRPPAVSPRGWLRARVSSELQRRAVTFVAIGVASTALYGAAYLLLRMAFAAVIANVAAQLVSTFFSTAANRKYTLGITDPPRRSPTTSR